jgi:mediator of RNA polymerase II transcription subunit 31
MAEEASQDVSMGSPPPAPTQTEQEPKYGGYSRFEIELEVRSASSPSSAHPWLKRNFV